MSNPIGRVANLFVSRAARRFLVLVVLAAPILGLALVVPQSGESLSVGRAASLLLLVLAGFSLVLLLHITSHAATNPRALLDERGLSVRGRAFELAYWLLAGAITAALAYGWTAATRGLWLPVTASDWVVVAGIAGYLLVTLPASAVAWIEPDVVIDHDEMEESTPIVYAGQKLSRAHRFALVLAMTGSLILIVAQMTGLSAQPAELNYVLGGIVTGCLLQLLMVRSSRVTR